jgi:hypothetical protein
MKEMTRIQISEAQTDKNLDSLNEFLNMDYNDFDEWWRFNKWELQDLFILLWVLKKRENERAINIRTKFKLTHWKQDMIKKHEENRKDKLTEIAKEKNKFLSNCKFSLSDDETKMKILNTYDTDLGWIITIGCAYYDMTMNKQKFWSTVNIYEYHTPELYHEV